MRTLLYVRRYSVDVIFWDQWDFLEPVFRELGALAQFDWQHGPHRQGLGDSSSPRCSAGADGASGPEALASALIVIAAALWPGSRCAGRSASRPGPTCRPAALPGQGWRRSSSGRRIPAHGPVPMALVFAIALAWTIRRPSSAPSWPALGVLCVFTGFGFFVGLVQPLLFAAEWVHGRGDPPRRARQRCWGSSVRRRAPRCLLRGWRPSLRWTASGFHIPRPLEYLDYLGFLLSRPLGMHRLGGGRTWIARGVALACSSSRDGSWRGSSGETKLPGRVVALLFGFTASSR